MSGLIRLLWLPPWRRAPLRTLGNGPLFLGLAVAAFVLAVAGGSRPMLASSAATETLRQDIEAGCRFMVGLQVERVVAVGDAPAEAFGTSTGPSAGPGAEPQIDDGTDALDEAVGMLPGIGPAVVTVEGGRATLTTDTGDTGGDDTGDNDTPGATGDSGNDTGGNDTPGGGGGPALVQLVSRTGAEDHIEILDGTPGPGAWLPDVVAEDLAVGPGDETTVTIDETSVPVTVAAVYRDLRADRDRHWCSMRHLFETPGSDNPPPPVVLFDQEQLLDVLVQGQVPAATATWEHPPTGHQWFLPRARAATRHLDAVADHSNNLADPLGRLLLPGDSTADVVGSVRRAERTATAVDSMAAPVALGTVGVAVIMLFAAARSWLQRQSQEITVLALRGAGPAALAVKAVLELAAPMVLGAAVGLGGAVLLIRSVGPSPHMEAAAIADGARFVAGALAVALVGAGLVVAAGVRRVGLAVGRAVTTSRRWWWEVVVLALAGAALYELRTRQGPLVDDTRVDALLLLFPLLLLVGGAGLLARLVLAGRPLGWVAPRLPTPAWLAARRLAAARNRAALIVTGAALATGIVVFAATLSSSLRATAYAKQTLGPGAAQVVRLTDPVPPPDDPSLQDISTLVTRTSEEGVVRRGHDSADVLGVDPDTFADAAFWDASFADRSLTDLLDLLDTPSDDTDAATGADPVPAIAVGDQLPDQFVLTLSPTGPERRDVTIEVDLAGRAEAFPGYHFQRDRPLVVVNRDVLTDRGVLDHAEIWIDDPSPAVSERLAAAGAPVLFSTRPSENDDRSLLQPQTWATDYLEVVGLAAGLVTVAALGLYFAANATRRRVGTALARELGLPARSRVAATALEVTWILLAGFVFGTALAWVAVHLVFQELDPLPNSPPAAIFRLDRAIVAFCGLGALVASVLATAVVERRAARASLPELLRDGR